MDFHVIFNKASIQRIPPLVVMKMHIDYAKSDVALKNLNALGDIELILGFLCIFLLLEIVHTSISKFHKVELFSSVTLWVL